LGEYRVTPGPTAAQYAMNRRIAAEMDQGRELTSESSRVRTNSSDSSELNANVTEITNGRIPTTNAIKVNDCIVSTLIDTGACFTFLNLSTLPEEMEFFNVRPYNGKAIVSASGHKLMDVKMSKAYFRPGRIITKHEVLLVKGLPHDCIIGVDWLRRLRKFSMSYIDGIVCEMTYENFTETLEITPGIEKEAPICLETENVLMPGHVKLLAVTIPNGFCMRNNDCAIFMSETLPPGVGVLEERVKRIRCITAWNESEDAILLPKGLQIGTVKAVQMQKVLESNWNSIELEMRQKLSGTAITRNRIPKRRDIPLKRENDFVESRDLGINFVNGYMDGIKSKYLLVVKILVLLISLTTLITPVESEKSLRPNFSTEPIYYLREGGNLRIPCWTERPARNSELAWYHLDSTGKLRKRNSIVREINVTYMIISLATEANEGIYVCSDIGPLEYVLMRLEYAPNWYTAFTFVQVYESLYQLNKENSTHNILRLNVGYALKILWKLTRRQSDIDRHTPIVELNGMEIAPRRLKMNVQPAITETQMKEHYRTYQMLVYLRELTCLLLILIGSRMILYWLLEKITIEIRKPTVKLKKAKLKGRTRN